MKDTVNFRSKKCRCALKLVALTFVRPGELCQAEWTEIEWNAAIRLIPAYKMKIKRPHAVPLSRQARVHYQLSYLAKTRDKATENDG